MTKMIQCISPVDGSVYAERPAMPLEAAKEVVARAKSVLEKLEKGRAETGGIAAGLGDLPLFAAAIEAAEEHRDALRERLQGLDIDSLSPREALDLLYEIRREACEG